MKALLNFHLQGIQLSCEIHPSNDIKASSFSITGFLKPQSPSSYFSRSKFEFIIFAHFPEPQPIQTVKLQTSTLFFTQESLFLKADNLKIADSMNLSSLTPNQLRSSILTMTREKFFIPNLGFSIFYHPKNGICSLLNIKTSQSISNLNISISQTTKRHGVEHSTIGASTIPSSSPPTKESPINIFKVRSSNGGHISGSTQIPYLHQ